MPKFQDRVNGNDIDQYPVPLRNNRLTLIDEIADRDAVLALTDGELQALIDLGTLNFTTVQAFRDQMTADKEVRQQQLRLWELDTTPLTFDEIIDTYVLFDPAFGGAIQSKCGEEVGEPATNVLTEGSKWAHLFDELHEIILDLGNPEVINGIGVRIDAGAGSTSLLRGVSVHSALNVNNIDNPNNIKLTNQDFATVDSDNEVAFPSNTKARYVKLTNISTDHGQNFMRIKNIKVKVVAKFFGEE